MKINGTQTECDRGMCLCVLLAIGVLISPVAYYLYQFNQMFGHGPSERDRANRTERRAKLKQLNRALLHYAHDHKGYFPLLTDVETVKQALGPYVSGNDVFFYSRTHKPFQFNQNLSKRNIKAFSLSETVSVYELSTESQIHLGGMF